MNENDLAPKVIYNLKMMERLCKSSNDVWKMKAYNKAHRTIIFPIYTNQDIVIYKFGKSIQQKVSYIIETNKDLQEVVNMDQSQVRVQEDLASIHAIGNVKANDLVHTHNISTIEELRTNLHLLNEKQRIGLKYHDDISKQIPRAEMIQHDDMLRSLLTTTFPKVINCAIVGSFRRQKQHSGDIDMIVEIEECDEKSFMQSLVDTLIDNRYIPYDGILAKGQKKVMGICTLGYEHPHRRIDVLVTNPKEYVFSVLYFTGNGEFNVKMRKQAKILGYRLNEKGIFMIDTKERVQHGFQHERDIFTFLGIEYVEPPYREPNFFKLMNNSNNTEK